MADGVPVGACDRHLGGWVIRFDRRSPRDSVRPVPLWMLLNLYRGKCWCGAEPLKPNKRLHGRGRLNRYCGKKTGPHRGHSGIWYCYIQPWWALYRYWFLRQHAKCEKCGAEATDVDHVTPIAMDGPMWDTHNHQALCRPCHQAKTAKDLAGIALHGRASRALGAGGSLDAFVRPADAT